MPPGQSCRSWLAVVVLLKVGGCLLFWWLVVLVELMVLLVLACVGVGGDGGGVGGGDGGDCVGMSW